MGVLLSIGLVNCFWFLCDFLLVFRVYFSWTAVCIFVGWPCELLLFCRVYFG
jgi:hypothetical protein